MRGRRWAAGGGTYGGGMRRVGGIAAVVVGLVVGVLALGIGAVAAHDALLSTTPKDGATLEIVPPAVVLKFEAAPLKDTTKIVATDSAGKQFPLTNVVVTGTTATAPWPAAANTAGTYQVAWRNVGSDGHPLNGSFSFSFTTSGSGPTARANPTASPGANIGVPTPLPTTSPVAATGPTGIGGTVWLLPTLIAVLILIGAIFGMQAARKRKRNDRPNT